MIGLQCPVCKHYKMFQECPAFKNKIPQEIFEGSFDHTKIHPEQDDKTILFEPITEEGE